MKGWREIIKEEGIEGRLPIDANTLHKYLEDLFINRLKKDKPRNVARFCLEQGLIVLKEDTTLCTNPKCETCRLIEKFKK